jgi:FixJ family two-component response regulator
MARQASFTVSIVDDDESVLKGLSRLLRAASYEAACYQSPFAFLSAYDGDAPGCVIADLSMDDMSGLQLQQKLLERDYVPPLVFLTGTGDIPSSVKAMKAGAVDFLLKPVDRANLLAAIARAEEVDGRNRKECEEVGAIRERLATLTPREREVLGHVVAGRLNKQIAAALGTVEKTVKVHRGRMMAKLGLHCVADLVRLAARAGIMPTPPLGVGPKVNSTAMLAEPTVPVWHRRPGLRLSTTNCR